MRMIATPGDDGFQGTVSSATMLGDGRLSVASSAGLFQERTAGSRRFFQPYPQLKGTVYRVLDDADGDRWVGGTQGLFVDRGTGLEPIRWWANAGPPRPGEPPVYWLAVDGERLWVAGAAGLAELDTRTNRVRTLYTNTETIQAPAGATTVLTPRIRPWFVTAGDDGRIYVAGEAGVLAIDPSTRRFVAATQYGANARYPGSAAIAIAQLGQRVFVGDDNGVFVTDTELKEWSQFSLPKKLPASTVRAIMRDPGRERLWFALAGGLFRYDHPEGSWRFYDTVDGLHSTNFEEGALTVTDAGTVLVGAGNGVSLLNPEGYAARPIPTPELLELTINDQPVSRPGDDQMLTLRQDQRRMSARFGAPTTWLARQLTLSYQLVGDDRHLTSNPSTHPYSSNASPPAHTGWRCVFRIPCAAFPHRARYRSALSRPGGKPCGRKSWRSR